MEVEEPSTSRWRRHRAPQNLGMSSRLSAPALPFDLVNFPSDSAFSSSSISTSTCCPGSCLDRFSRVCVSGRNGGFCCQGHFSVGNWSSVKYLTTFALAGRLIIMSCSLTSNSCALCLSRNQGIRHWLGSSQSVGSCFRQADDAGGTTIAGFKLVLPLRCFFFCSSEIFLTGKICSITCFQQCSFFL